MDESSTSETPAAESHIVTPGESAAATPPIATSGRSPVERAEHLVDRFGQRLNTAREQMAGRSAAQSSGNGQPQRPAMERAEETLDRVGHQVGIYAARTGHELRKFFARAREEAEDMWAEAQNMSHHQTPPPEPPPQAPEANPS